MQYRTLGSTGLSVSVIGMGTWQLGGEWGKAFAQAEVDAMFDKAVEVGINLIDTAECYGPDHLSESLIGRAIRGRRDQFVIATKFGHRFTGFLKRSDERGVDHVREQLEASLKALGTDYVDLYQYHSVRDEEFENPELWAFLAEAKRAGKIRHVGNSISNNMDLRPQAERSAAAGVAALQVVYNRLERKAEAEAFEAAARQNLGVLARVPLASGYLSGKYKPGATFAGGDYRTTQDRAKVDEKLREVERIAREEVPAGADMAQWALAWCLKDPVVTAVIPGCKSVEQVGRNAGAAEWV